MTVELTFRPAGERGHAEHGWLDSRHTFSFADYHDPAHMGYRALRVINEDRVQPGRGFGTHSHRDMEIVTYVLEGALAHRDSTGTGSVIRPGDVQRMSAGTGVSHSEMNASSTEPVHFLQIWILPERNGLPAGYQERSFQAQPGRWQLLGARDGRDGSVTIHQDVALWRALLEAGQSVEHRLVAGRHAWMQVARGKVRLGDRALASGDGAAVRGATGDVLTLTAEEPSELLLFDLA